MNTIEELNMHVMPTYGRYDVVMESGKERIALDENGKSYVDFGSGIGVNSLGFCDGSWAEAVCAQARSIQHTSNYYYTKVQADFAARLCETAGYEKAFFCNSGAEANECAIKLARKYSFDRYGKGRHNIITLENSFHGRTMATLSATGQEVFHNYFFPFLEGFVNVKPNDIGDLEQKLDSSVCAVMMEFVQGEGGVIALEEEFVERVFRLCKEHDILVIADEVQTGVGRTGRFLASEHYRVHPDITTLAKGIAGGLPMGVCLAEKGCCDVLGKSTHGSTFGGNPVCCAGGNAVLDRLTADGFMTEICEKAEYLRNRLSELPQVESLSGIGLMIGIRLKSRTAADCCRECLENGLLVLTAKDKLRLLPPLTISYEEIDKGVDILAKVLA